MKRVMMQLLLVCCLASVQWSVSLGTTGRLVVLEETSDWVRIALELPAGEPPAALSAVCTCAGVMDGPPMEITAPVTSVTGVQSTEGRLTVLVASKEYLTPLAPVGAGGTAAVVFALRKSAPGACSVGEVAYETLPSAPGGGGATVIAGEDDSAESTSVGLDAVGSMRTYPNPGNPGFTIAYRGTPGERVELAMYDIQGREVWSRTGVGVGATGLLEEPWNGRSTSGEAVSSGVYFIRLVRGSGEIVTERAVLVK